MGESLTGEEREHFKRLTGRDEPPPERVSELWVIAGRRGGKSRAIATLIVFLACFVDYRSKLVAGEKGIVLCLAPSQTQAGIVLDYIAGILKASPILAQLIVRETAETIELQNKIVIDVRSASFRRLRGPTTVAVVLDEIAFFHSDESANPDVEIVNAIRPSLGTTDGLLVGISSPYARRGVLYDVFKRDYGAQGDTRILVAKASTRDLNPSYPQEKIDREFERDPAYAAAEFGGKFRSDIESFITIEAVRACDPSIRERPYDRKFNYTAFVDPSGGSSDSFTLAISHKEGKTAVLDVVREYRPPFSPEGVVEEFCRTLRDYRITMVTGDKYAGEWPREQFRKRAVSYDPSEKSKSEIYQAALPLINSRTAALLENATLERQLVGLERRTSRGGKDSIDHGPGGRDDVANACAGALVFASEKANLPGFDRDIVYPAMGYA
jgi:hypothetical protein